MVIDPIVQMIVAPAVAAIVSWYLNRDLKGQVSSQGAEIQRLRDNTIKQISDAGEAVYRELRQHLHEDKTQGIEAKLKHIASQVDKIEGTISALAKDTAEQGADIKRNRESVGRSHQRLDEHINDHNKRLSRNA